MDSVYTGSTSANNEIYSRKAYLNAVQYSKQPEMQSTAEVKQQETASAPEETYQASQVEDNHQIYSAADGVQASKNYTLPDFKFDMDSDESIKRMEDRQEVYPSPYPYFSPPATLPATVNIKPHFNNAVVKKM